jgi:hypothetical protein
MEGTLPQGPHMKLCKAAGHVGRPETASTMCAFRRLGPVTRIGRQEARATSEALRWRNRPGLVSQDADVVAAQMCETLRQSYSMAGIADGARPLSGSWEAVV